MLPFPVPSFEQQRLEIMQRYRLIAPPGVMRVSVLAEAAGRALGFPMVFAALTERHRDRFAVHWGIEPGHLAMVSSLCMRTNLSEDTFWVAEAEADAHFAGHLAVTDGPRVRAFAGAPMRAGGGARLGTLCLLSDRADGPAPDPAAVAAMADLASGALCASSAARYAVADLIEAERTKRAFYDMAMTDPLTGVLNRRAFFDVAAREVGRAARHDRPLTVIALDADHFKSINDEHGHAVGDQVLKGIAASLRGGLRDEDAIGRLGGEEFAVLLPETGEAAALRLADRLRRLVAATEHGGRDAPLRVTVSMGVSAPKPGEPDIACALKRADEAVYAGKAAGRNRVTSAKAA